MRLYVILGLWPTVWLGGQEVRWNIIGKLLTRRSEEMYVARPLLIDKTHEEILSQ